MATTPSVKVEKQFIYKGRTTVFSNRYHFNGGTPADATHWHTLFDAIVLAEKAIFPANVTIVSCIGYAAGSDVPVASKTYTTAGTFSQSGNDHGVPGDCAALVRYSTTARTSKNHPVYLFNYYHAIFYDNTVGAPDKLAPDQKTAMETYAGSWITGFTDGSITAVRAGPNGATATGHITEEFITHRDFPPNSSV